MSIAISMQTEGYGKTEAGGQQPSEVDRSEQKKKKAAEQLQRVGQNNVSEEVSVPDKVAKVEPSVDQFIRSDGSETNPAGTYSLKKDGHGNSKIVYDKHATGSDALNETSDKKGNPLVSPKKPDDNPNKAPENSPSNKSGGLECTVNTDKVDAEIKNLKKEKQRIEQEIKQAGGDENKKSELEQRLKEIDAELQTKDTDAYRKQSATVTYKSIQK
ncbi:MAG TPA: hypothetical protein VHR42_09405 [Clostridia bacterium]|nr:hypothetical protein [Clostridia bacterium]